MEYHIAKITQFVREKSCYWKRFPAVWGKNCGQFWFSTQSGGSGRSYGHILLGGGAATLLELNIFLMFLHLPQQRIQCLFNRKLTRLPLPSVFSQGEYLPFLSFDIPYRLTHHMIHQPYILHLLPLLAKILEKVLKYFKKKVQPRDTIFYICWFNTVPWN